MYTLWHHCRIATMAAGQYQLLDDGAMLTDGAVLLWVGNRAEMPDLPVAQQVDLQGRVVTPGLVDCHSHAVFGGDPAAYPGAVPGRRNGAGDQIRLRPGSG